jgi:hypothetical protein
VDGGNAASATGLQYDPNANALLYGQTFPVTGDRVLVGDSTKSAILELQAGDGGVAVLVVQSYIPSDLTKGGSQVLLLNNGMQINQNTNGSTVDPIELKFAQGRGGIAGPTGLVDGDEMSFIRFRNMTGLDGEGNTILKDTIDLKVVKVSDDQTSAKFIIRDNANLTDALIVTSSGPTGPVGSQIIIGTHILPNQDSLYDLGATGMRFRDLYLSGNSLHLGNTVLSTDPSGNLQVTAPGATGPSNIGGASFTGLGPNEIAYNDGGNAAGATGLRFEKEYDIGGTVFNNALVLGATGSTSALYVNSVDESEAPAAVYVTSVNSAGTIFGKTTITSAGTEILGGGLSKPVITMNATDGTEAEQTAVVTGGSLGTVNFNDRGANAAAIKVTKVLDEQSVAQIALNVNVPGTGATDVLIVTSSGPTGPEGAQIRLAGSILPVDDAATYDIGSMDRQFNDIYFSGTIYNGENPFSGGGADFNPLGPNQIAYNLSGVAQGATGLQFNPSGSATLFTTDLAPFIGDAEVLTVGDGTKSTVIQQNASGPNGTAAHILQSFASGPTGPMSYNVITNNSMNTVVVSNNGSYPEFTMYAARGYATGPTGLNDGDAIGKINFYPGATLIGGTKKGMQIIGRKVGGDTNQNAQIVFRDNVEGVDLFAITSSGPTGPTRIWCLIRTMRMIWAPRACGLVISTWLAACTWMGISRRI